MRWPDLPAVGRHLGPFAQHRFGDFELLEQDRRRAFLLRELEALLPARDRELARDVLGELDRLRRAVAHAEQRDRGAEAEEAHAVTAFAHDLVALLRQRQAVDVDDVVEHARENLDDLAELVPVEVRVIAERRRDELREIDRAEQARPVGGQRLLAARVGGADVLAPPIVVHLVDAIDEHEAGLGEIVRRRHDDVPHATRGQACGTRGMRRDHDRRRRSCLSSATRAKRLAWRRRGRCSLPPLRAA